MRKYRQHPSIKVGDRFSRLVILRQSKREGEPRWICRCDCGDEKEILDRSLKNGHTRSCGCIHRERAVRLGQGKRTHGHSPKPNGKQQLTAEYQAWRSMRRRVLDPTSSSYKDYGGRGITICQRWLIFENFLADVGLKPDPSFTLERRDNNGPYSPENCYWASRTTQGRNKRNNVRVTIDGVTRTISEWAEVSGIKAGTLQQRVKYNWPSNLLLEPPKLGRRINAVR